MNKWRKDIASWRIGKVLYLSVPFSWLLPEAERLAGEHKGPVVAGGPAVDLNPGCLPTGQLPPGIRPLDFHNPLATFTSRGCPNRCGFCAVPRIEGEFRELEDWPVRPVVCDNNLLAASRKHFDRVIDRLKSLPYVDFNQGLDARKFTTHHASRMAELQAVKVRFAFDHLKEEARVANALATARAAGLRDFGVYVLVGFDDTPADALYRLERVREWGVRPNPMRYQPLDAREKNAFVGEGWSEWELRRVMKYYSRLRFLEHIPFAEYRMDDPLLPLWEVAS